MEPLHSCRAARCAALVFLSLSFAGCGGAASPVTASFDVLRQAQDDRARQAQADRAGAGVGLGPVLSDAFGGEIFGWDIDQNGTDGVLTETVTESNGTILNAIETFDQTTGQIVKVVRKSVRDNADVEPVADAIAGSDVGIIDVERDPGLTRHDHFIEMSPVSGNKLTGTSKPSHDVNVVPEYVTDNQASASQVMLALYRLASGSDAVGLYAYNTAKNTWGQRITFPRNQLFENGPPLYAAVDAQTNEAMTGYLGRQRYNPHESPSFDVLDASTGKIKRHFNGVGFGFINGMAIDSTTDTMCTTTQGDMDVEFYNLATGKGKAVQIPVLFGGGAETNGADVAADPIHHLFLVAQLNSTFSPSGGSTVIVYNEKGKLVEYINGFEFFDPFSVVVPRVAVNPATRSGYVNGPGANNLTQFTY